MSQQFICPVEPFGAADGAEDGAGDGDDDPGLDAGAVPERVEEREGEDGGVDDEEGPYYDYGAFVGVDGVGERRGARRGRGFRERGRGAGGGISGTSTW